LTPLTRREQQVLELLGHGYSNADISAALVLSESTVKTHVQHVLNKLNLRNRVSAAIYARERGLEPSPGSPQGERWRERGLRPG
jgi:DNA-binding NarL/FixJ family response regulator